MSQNSRLEQAWGINALESTKSLEMAINAPGSHVRLTGSPPPIDDIGDQMSAFAESTSGAPPGPDAPLEDAKRGFLTHSGSLRVCIRVTLICYTAMQRWKHGR